MDNAPSSLFSDLTDMKKKNSGLKAIVALGGWTFNDNGTATQLVYSDMVGSSGNRAKFISNLMSFLREYAFDGVDFDWVIATTYVSSHQLTSLARNTLEHQIEVGTPMTGRIS